MEKREQIKREIETLILFKVGDRTSSIDSANHVDEVICALHRLALCLLAVESSAIASVVDESHRRQMLSIPTNEERDKWWHGFYHRAAFPAMAKILIYNVDSNWLSKFPISAKKQVHDSFFVQGPSHKTIQALVPALARNRAVDEFDYKIVCSNVERREVVVGEFRFMSISMEHVYEVQKADKMKIISRIAQLLASIPDKARPDASSALSSQCPPFTLPMHN